jgi:serine/threonine protein kinase
MLCEAHPTAEQLAAFGLGKLDDSQSAALEMHLADCETCRRALETQAADSFVALARSVRTAQPGDWDGHLHAVPSGAPTCTHPAAANAPCPEVPPELAEHPRYRILGLIGVGGMGAVFKAEHLLMHRVVALKVINRRLVANPSMVERFTREVIAAGSLSHPNIVHYHDAEHIGDTHFLVMEYVEGTNLAKLMAQTGPLPIAQACAYIRQAALGLQHAFERGMVHRDIKPQNLMVVSGDSGVQAANTTHHSLLTTHQVKILDFGLARLAQETAPLNVDPVAETKVHSDKPTPSGVLTQIGTVMGTPDYIAPEQARDAHAADIRSDIYSLGCTFYDLLTGKPPFPDGTVMQKVIAHLEQPPRPVTELRAEVPRGLARIVEKMLAKDPAQRYQTPAEVGEALAPFVQAAASIARAEPPALPPKHRRRWWAALAACFVVAAAVAASLFLPTLQDLAQTAIRIATNKGVLVIEADDEDLEIAIKQPGKEPVVQIINKKTKQSFELTAVDGEIFAKQLPDGIRAKTTEFQLIRGGKLTFRAQVLLGEAAPSPLLGPQVVGRKRRQPAEPLATEGTLVIENRHPRARIKVFIVGQMDMMKVFGNMMDAQSKFMENPADFGKFLKDVNVPEIIQFTLGPGQAWKTSLKEDQYEVTAEGDPPQAFAKTTRLSQVVKGKETRLTFGDEVTELAPVADFQPLIKGKDLNAWEGDTKFWSVNQGELAGGNGFIHTKQSFENYELRLQFRISPKQSIKPPPQSPTIWLDLEDRGKDAPAAGIGISLTAPEGPGLFAAGGVKFQEYKEMPLTKPIRISDWNDLRIMRKDGKIALYINYELRAIGFTGASKRGFIGLQTGFDILHIRNIEIADLSPQQEPGFQPLFNGKDLDGLVGYAKADAPIDPKKLWDMNGGLVIYKGRYPGLLRTAVAYKDFVLKLEYRFPLGSKPSGHSGLLLHMSGPDTTTLLCGHVGLSSAGGTLRAPNELNRAPVQFLLPQPGGGVAGEWRTLVITAKDGRIEVASGGKVLALLEGLPRLEGFLGLYSHAEEIQFRNIEVKKLPN